jgi:hypothetical protein
MDYLFRTGQRSAMGLFKDGYNSCMRYVLNNFFDGFRQVKKKKQQNFFSNFLNSYIGWY